MRPLGQKKVRFPGKTKEWLGKRVKMWWEDMAPPNKKAGRQNNSYEIKCSLAEKEYNVEETKKERTY